MWDERYGAAHYAYGTEPNDFLRESFPLITSGPILCLAEGEGRNAVFLARQGFDVTAVDQSQVGLNKAKSLAQRHEVNVHCICANLNDFELGQNKWGAIISIFGHLPPVIRTRVHQGIVQSLKPGGVFIAEAYTPAQLHYGTGGPKDPQLLLSKAIFERELAALELLKCQEIKRRIIEGQYHTGDSEVAQVIARKQAPDY